MKIKTASIKYYLDDTWTDIDGFVEADVIHSTSPTKSIDTKSTGIYSNKSIKTLTLYFVDGMNEYLDEIKRGKEVQLSYRDGAFITNATYKIADNYVFSMTYIEDNEQKTKDVRTLECELNPNYEIEYKPIINGSSSGVQDVQIEGTTIVDPDTGVANITTLTTKADFKTAVEEVTKEITALNQYCDDLDATKLDTISYVELTGTKGTLTDEQRATLLSGSPTLNFIEKDNMLFKCVYYKSGTKAVYSIAGESKIHVITVTLPAGTWALTTYNLQPTLTAGDGITIKNNVISASGGVSQDYVDEQDQAILATATERIDAEGTERATMDSTLSEAILKESDARSEADITLQTNIDNEIVARTEEDVKLQANIEEEATTRQAVDEKLLTAVNNKQDILTAGTNITIVDNVISASGGGSATSFISLKGTSGTVTTDQLKVLGANFANYILVVGTDDTTRRFTFVQEPFPSMNLHYVCINQNKVDLLTITQGNNKWSITDGSELAKQTDLEAVDAKLGEDENGIYVDL